MTIYDDALTISKELFAEFKQGTISLVSITAGDGDADDPGEPTEVVQALNATTKKPSYAYIKDGFALATDVIILAAPLDGVTVGPNDFIEIDGVRHKIVQDMTTPGAGTKVVWKFLVRK